MEIVYNPKTSVTIAEFADKFGLKLVIEGVVSGDSRFRASLGEGLSRLSVTGTGDTAVSASVDLMKRLSGSRIMCSGVMIQVPVLVKGGLDVVVKAAVDKYKAD